MYYHPEQPYEFYFVADWLTADGEVSKREDENAVLIRNTLNGYSLVKEVVFVEELIDLSPEQLNYLEILEIGQQVRFFSHSGQNVEGYVSERYQLPHNNGKTTYSIKYAERVSDSTFNELTDHDVAIMRIEPLS